MHARRFPATPARWWSRAAAALLALLCAGVVWAQVTVEVTTATELRANPALDAQVLQRLDRGASVQQLEVRGGWVRVRVGNREGWVRSNTIRSAAAAPAAAERAAAPAAPAAGGLGNLASAFSGSSNRPTATTGTRGLTQEQLANAQPAPARSHCWSVTPPRPPRREPPRRPVA